MSLSFPCSSTNLLSIILTEINEDGVKSIHNGINYGVNIAILNISSMESCK